MPVKNVLVTRNQHGTIKKLHMPWYDIECKTHKHRFSQAKHKLKLHKNSHTLLAVHNARTPYDKCCKTKKAKHDKRLTE